MSVDEMLVFNVTVIFLGHRQLQLAGKSCATFHIMVHQQRAREEAESWNSGPRWMTSDTKRSGQLEQPHGIVQPRCGRLCLVPSTGYFITTGHIAIRPMASERGFDVSLTSSRKARHAVQAREPRSVDLFYLLEVLMAE